MQNIGMTYRYTYRERVEPKKEWVGVPVLSAEPDRTGGLCVERLLGEPPHPLDRGHRRVIFHSGGSLMWKKAACAGQAGLAKSRDAVGRAGFPGGRNRNRREGYGRNKTGGVPV